MFRKNDKLIVLEDDNLTSPFFLQFMNDSLNLYKSISKLKPKKIECKIKNRAEPTPKNKKYLFLLVS